ncbi:hypothetical protein ACEWY4_022492 [Coilia grayii]|uniref:ELM2 and SANT domain-containing protein 1 n=1 Tax=Coilia grayii TaxID=363190 RepID=A0ABD1J786_9TELE
MKEAVQHPGEVYYNVGSAALEQAHDDTGSRVPSNAEAQGPAVFNPDKGHPGRAHFPPGAPMKWMHQDAVQAPGWPQGLPNVPGWGQNFSPYRAGMGDARGQMVYAKPNHDSDGLPLEKPPQSSGEAYKEAQARGLEWDQRAAAVAMRHAQIQAFQQGHKPGELPCQPHTIRPGMQGSMLQPFQLAFGATKQPVPSAYYQVFPGNNAMASMPYGEQAKAQHQLLQLQQQQQQMQQQQQQQQQQQHQQQRQLQQQQHHQMQQHQQQQQQARHQLQQQQQHQMQQHHMQQQQQQQQLHQIYHQQQLQQMHHMQQQQQQQSVHLQPQPQPNVPQQEPIQPQPHAQSQPQQLDPHPPPYQSDSQPSSASPPPTQQPQPQPKLQLQSQLPPVQPQTLAPPPKPQEPPPGPAPAPAPVVPEPSAPPAKATPETQDPPVLPRRSRRLSKDGLSPTGATAPSSVPWNQVGRDPLGAPGRGEGIQGLTGGVIQSTRRRRASKEINLETLAQKASEMESLPAKVIKTEDSAPGMQGVGGGMVPLVIPVSVPVQRDAGHGELGSAWPHSRAGSHETAGHHYPAKHTPSVIVARRRSLKNTAPDSLGQDEAKDDDGPKSKRRPRPEPLFIPPPKVSNFIAPSVYSSITSYQSHLRSPVRLPDNPLALPPYTPPPILSPVREGSGLYFSTFLSSMAAGSQGLPPPPTPKSAARSLLRSSSSDITPPVLPPIGEATPVSLEPRINIGLHYQAEIPEIRDRSLAQQDQHKANLVWIPLQQALPSKDLEERVDDLMSLACSSVLAGGGTNQELALHCLHESRGDVMETLTMLLLKNPIYPENHPLADYHYSGSDTWSQEEKRYFNKGIAAYRKDFFMVQKLVRTKTVAQCVEYYYTYKKQVKIGRNGTLAYGPPDPEEHVTEGISRYHASDETQDSKTWQEHHERPEERNLPKAVPNLHNYTSSATESVIKLEREERRREEGPPAALPPQAPPTSTPRKPRAEPAGKKSKPPAKAPQEPEGVFPCKKCGRIFHKVKSRSAHMKSHAEQEKKAAAQRQREEEERVAAAAAAAVAAAALARQRASEAAVAAAAQNGGGEEDEDEEDEENKERRRGRSEQVDNSSGGESSETAEDEDEDDKDWQ